jgi:ABC-type lipoprotein release transport system permease subunit
MITRTILHALWAVIVFVFAVTVALGVLFMLGAASAMSFAPQHLTTRCSAMARHRCSAWCCSSAP